jgi:ATP-dependent DNA helicase RecG
MSAVRLCSNVFSAGPLSTITCTKGSAASACWMAQPADYVRQAGFDPIQQEQMVLQYARAHGRITRKDAATLCRISANQASRLLRKLRSENKLQQEGQGRAVIYVRRANKSRVRD